MNGATVTDETNRPNRYVKLYKYRSLEPFEFVADIICNNRFHAALFRELNDPMEGLFEAGSLVEHYHLPQLEAAREKTRICSFSGTWRHPVLWAYYADGFKGVCIEVEVSTLQSSSRCLTDGLMRESVGDILFASVDYSPVANAIHTEPEVKDACIMPDLLLGHKAKEWCFENEVRAFSNDEFIQCNDDIRITRIFLGVRMPPGMQRLIRRITPSNIAVCKILIRTWAEIELDEAPPLGEDTWELR